MWTSYKGPNALIQHGRGSLMTRKRAGRGARSGADETLLQSFTSKLGQEPICKGLGSQCWVGGVNKHRILGNPGPRILAPPPLTPTQLHVSDPLPQQNWAAPTPFPASLLSISELGFPPGILFFPSPPNPAMVLVFRTWRKIGP